MIKKAFVTAINKQLSLYGSFSYFSGKTTAKNLKLLSASNLLNCFVEKRLLKENLKFQLAHVDGSNVKTSVKKIHDFLITKLGKRQKTNMTEPIETIIVRTQQNSDVVRGLNPIQIETEDDRILNIFKKCKNVVHKIIPLGLLIPATVTIDTQQIFITGKELSGVKKSIPNSKSIGHN